jgi:hypothetical protein
MFGKLGPNAFYIHAVFNLFAMACVYCIYPETACRTLEEVSSALHAFTNTLPMLIFVQIDLLFGSNTLWVWDTEKKFQELKLEHSALVHGIDHRKLSNSVEHVETVALGGLADAVD